MPWAECLRRLCWTYYGSHNGFPADPPSGDARLAYVLKQVTTLHAVAGTAIDDYARHSAFLVRDREAPLPAARMAALTR